MSEPVTYVLTLTAAGDELARSLPWAARTAGRGGPRLADQVRDLWTEADRLVLVCATGIAVRTVAPLLGTASGAKHTDPAVVCLDDAGRWAVALTGGHRPGGSGSSGSSGGSGGAGGTGGANDLAREVAALVGAEPVVTTASDAADDVVALDTLPGWTAIGDVAAVTRRWLDGEPPTVDRSDLPDWPLPSALSRSGGAQVDTDADHAGSSRLSGGRHLYRSSPVELARHQNASSFGPEVRVSDRVLPGVAGTAGTAGRDPEVQLCPRSLVVGVGSSSGVGADEVRDLVHGALAEAGLRSEAVGLIATVDLKAEEPGIVALADDLGVELRTFPAGTLAGIDVPHPSDVVQAAVGTPSVAEAAALVAAGGGGSAGDAGPTGTAELVVGKQRSADATVAVARRSRPEGHLDVVGLGPGGAAWRTPAATAAVRHADVLIGYSLYLDQVADLQEPRHEVVRSPIGAEADRCAEALRRAAAGQQVALVCSGDPGVYAMASLVEELVPVHGSPPVRVVPGVTAALSTAALLGAPLGHDHVNLSLSDLLTPWEVIERRVAAAAASDLVVSFYNPRSRRRTWQLEKALALLGEHRPADCPVAVATDVGRPGQQLLRTTLAELDPGEVGMLSLVMVGSSTTRWVGDRMVTPRGYPVDGGDTR